MSKFNLGELLKDAGVSELNTAQEQIEYIPLEKIDPDPENFYSLEGLDELAGNIETVGLQQPLRVRALSVTAADGGDSSPRGGSQGRRYVVVSGHRRRAALMLIRDGGSEMFSRGVPCIVERGDVSREMQELRLIYANSSTRVLSSAELSKQAERVEDLLYKLQEQGVVFPGRMRDHVAAAVNASKSKLARLHAIRNNLDSDLLPYYDGGDLTEDAAYALSRFPPNLQEAIARELTGGKRKKTPVASVLKEVLERLDGLLKPIPCRAHAGGTECHHGEGRMLCSVFKQYSWDICPEGQCCVDCYKGKQGCSGACREAKDRFKLEKDVEAEKAAERKAADDVKFDRRRADIERRCRELMPLVDAAGLKDEDRLWDNYEAATAGQVRAWATDGAGDQTFYGDGCVNPHFTDGLRQMAKRLKVPVSVLLGEKQEGLAQPAPAWKTGTPPEEGWFAVWARYSISPSRTWDPDYEILYWTGEYWTGRPGGAKSLDYDVLAWYPLPGKMGKDAAE